VNLLILDEAGFIDPSLWRAAEPTIIARPGSRVILTSTPWGGPEHFFPMLFRRGLDRPDLQVQAWHWPSSIAPLVDRQLLGEIQSRESPDYFAREYLAEWSDETGSYFTEAEIMGAVADYEMLSPERSPSLTRGTRTRRRLPGAGPQRAGWTGASQSMRTPCAS
jgi:hypothetical protein